MRKTRGRDALQLDADPNVDRRPGFLGDLGQVRCERERTQGLRPTIP